MSTHAEAAGGGTLLGSLARGRRIFGQVPEAATAGVCLLMFAGWSIATPNFLTVDNLLSVAQQVAFIGIVGVGMTYLLISGELDLSVGSAYGFLGILLAEFTLTGGIALGPAIALTILAGVLIGFVNGVLTTSFTIPSFVVTLAMLGVLRGLSLVLADGVPQGPFESQTFESVAGGRVFGEIPAQVLWLAAVAVIGGIVLARTKFGYDLYATGGNRRAALYAGIAVNRTKVIAFMITGGLVAMVAVLTVGWLGNANPLTGEGFELSVIAAVVIGGTSLFGGAGSVTGTILGAAIIGMLNNGLVLVGVEAYWNQVATGSIIALAALMNVGLRGRAQREY